MLRNYLRIAWRNITRNMTYSLINIGGLAVGITCSLLIFLWVWDQITFDEFHPNADRLGTLAVHDVYSDKTITSFHSPFPAYEFLKSYNNQIKNTCLYLYGNKQQLKSDNTVIAREGNVVSQEFLTMFQFPLIRGSADNVLKEPNSIVLTEEVAKALFGDKDPMGRIVRVSNQYDMMVTGVLKDLPTNTKFKFQFLLPWSAMVSQSKDWIMEISNWRDETVRIAIEMQPGADRDEVNALLTHTLREKRGSGDRSEMFIHPLTDWHLHSKYENGKQVGGGIEYVKSFTLIGVFIVVIACINFMNLATARSARRAREVGIRKTVGSRRIELIRQFLGEAILLVALAFAFALLLSEISLPLFNNLVGKELILNYQSPMFWLTSMGFILTIGTLSGSYPAFYLSSFNPVKVLKGNLNAGRESVAPRRVLVSLQFFFSIFLMVGVAVIVLQIQYVKARDMGYSREGLVMTSANEEIVKNYPEIERQLLASGAVESMTVSSSPVTDIHKDGKLSWPGKYDGYEISFSRVMTGYNYTKTLGIKVESGRDFSAEFPADTAAILLNRAAVQAMGVQDPVGMEVQLLPFEKKWKVVGVIDDVVMKSPFDAVQPGFFMCMPRWIDAITMRLAPAKDLNESLATVETIFKKLNPSDPFEFQFVNDEFDQKFAEINMVGTLVALFAFLALFITGLGLLGLAAFTAEQRTKEIGIRKTMGATTNSIIALLSRDFARLMITGFILAAPLSWWILNSYLERYIYRIEFSWWIIPTVGMMAFLFTLLIVGSQAKRVAESNLVESLRNE